VAAALFSSGFHHFDEHYQIIEFARYFIHQDQAELLPWEYGARLRPALQPILAAAIMKMFPFNPWLQASIIQLFSALFLLYALSRFIANSDRNQTLITHKNMLWAAALFYIIPYMAARFSAEVFGLSWLLLALSSSEKKSYITTGLFFGLAVVVRLQLAFFILGWFLWLFIIHKNNLQTLAKLAAGAAIAFATGILADRIFYGEWTLTLWNYFEVNVLQDKSAEYGTHALLYYFSIPLQMGILSVLNAALLLASLWFFIKNPKHPLTWSLIPFVAGHLMVAHKEMRFLFPAIFFMPFMLFHVIQPLSGKRIFKVILGLLFIINMPVLMWKTFTPANVQPLAWKAVHELNPQVQEVYTIEDKEDFLRHQAGLHMPFYQQKIKLQPVSSEQLNLLQPGSIVINATSPRNDFTEVKEITPRCQSTLMDKWHIPSDNKRWKLYIKQK